MLRNNFEGDKNDWNTFKNTTKHINYCHLPLVYLIPCPGPQLIFSIHKLVVPGPIEMQSSPVPMFEFDMFTFNDCWTWIPSVFGLSLADETFTPWICTFWQPYTTILNIWLLTEDNPFTFTFCESKISRLYVEQSKQSRTIIIIISTNQNSTSHFLFQIFLHTVAPSGQLCPECLQFHNPIPWPSITPP